MSRNESSDSTDGVEERDLRELRDLQAWKFGQRVEGAGLTHRVTYTH